MREARDRYMVAERILRPDQLSRCGRDAEAGVQHLLIVVVTWPQHHAVLAERDRTPVAIGGDVADGQNRHCNPYCPLLSSMHRGAGGADRMPAAAQSLDKITFFSSG